MAEGEDYTEEPRRRVRPTGHVGVHLEEPYRRFSDGVDPRLTPSGRRGMHQAMTTRSAPPSAGRRCQSMSATIEQQMGQELRRISDEFHLSYQGPRSRAIPGRVQRDASPGPAQASSLPERRRRGSLVERFIGLFASPNEDGTENTSGDINSNEGFQPRRRAHSEISMASGLTPDMFGRQESILSTNSHGRSSSEHDDGNARNPTSRREDFQYDEVDNSYNDTDVNDEDTGYHQVMFDLSTDEQ